MALLSGNKKEDAAVLLVASEGHLLDDEPKPAKEAAEKAMSFSKDVRDPTGVADALRALILAQVATGEVEAGLAKAKEELANYEKSKDKHGEGAVLLAWAEAQIMNQEPEDALKKAKDAAAAFKAKGEKSWQAKAGLAAANAQLLCENLQEAKDAVDEAQKLFKEAGDKRGEASALEQLAVVELAKNRNLEVITALEQAVILYGEAGATREKGVALASQGELYLSRNKPTDALTCAKLAWEASKEAKHAQGVAGAMGLVARAYIANGRDDEAFQKMKDEAAECKMAKDAKGEAAALAAIFQARLAVQDPEGALQAARRALGCLATARDPKGSARMLHSIAAMEYERGYWDLAIRASKEALAVLAESGGSLKTSLSLETIVACSHDARGEEPPTTATREKALSVLKKLGTALEAENVEAFEVALKKLSRMSAVTDKDTDRAFAPAMEKNAQKAEEFLAQHMGDYQKAGPPEQPDLEREPDFALREFPVRVEFQAGVTAEGAEWTQTQGRMDVWYQLENGPHEGVTGGWRQEDVTVEMARQSIKIALGGKPLKTMSGDVTDTIWRQRSWWEVNEEGMLHLHLVKRDLQTWKSVWWAYDNVAHVNAPKFKRTPFPWNEAMRQHGSAVNKGDALLVGWDGVQKLGELFEEKDLEVKMPGRPESTMDEGPSYQRSSFAEVFQHPATNFMVSADELVLGITLSQDDKTVRVSIHFERWRYEDLKRRVSVEDVFAADIWEREICIFLQGDKQNPILWAELGGHCIPYETTWKLTSHEGAMRLRQRSMGSYCPTLEICLVRAESFKWDQIFTSCVQHKLMPKDPNDPAEEPERFEGLQDTPDLRRAGFDINSSDFWSYVEDYVDDTIKRTGVSTLPKKLVLA